MNKWNNPTFRKAYNRCKKQVERGSVPQTYNCMKYALQIFLEEERKQQERLQQLMKDPTYRHLKSILMKDRKGEEQAKRQEQHLDVDNIHLKLRSKKPKETVDLW